MPKYNVISPIKRGGKVRGIGSEIEMSAEEAAPMFGAELEAPAKPAKSDDKGGEKK